MIAVRHSRVHILVAIIIMAMVIIATIMATGTVIPRQIGITATTIMDRITTVMVIARKRRGTITVSDWLI